VRRPISLDPNVHLGFERRPCVDPRNSAGHVVSAWEIAIKHRSGKLLFDVPVEAVLSRILDGTVWPVLPVLPAHIPELLALPMHRRDPLDRLPIAQARAEGMALATADYRLRKYRAQAGSSYAPNRENRRGYSAGAGKQRRSGSAAGPVESRSTTSGSMTTSPSFMAFSVESSELQMIWPIRSRGMWTDVKAR
jgi:PIN domain nuclease of toxin-antitoxin system